MNRRYAFAGLKVADFSWVGVGPITTKYLADHGATVVRIESQVRPDVLRLAPPWRDGQPGLNRSQFFASFNASKYGITLDLGKPPAQEIAKKLEGYTGADTEALCREAGLTALREDMKAKSVSQKHFEAALEKVKPTIDPKVMSYYKKAGEKLRKAKVEEKSSEMDYVG